MTKAFDEERNTVKLLSTLKEGATSTDIISNILSDLLDREQKKLESGLKEKWEKDYPEFNNWSEIYTCNEQMIRIVEYILFNEIGSLYINRSIPEALTDDYIESIKTILPQHPFLQCFSENDGIFDFTGPAFRDYSLGYVLSLDDFSDLANEYFSSFMSGRIPSQLLFDFYINFTNMSISGKYFPLLYDSYKAKEAAGKNAFLDISGLDKNKFATFRICDTNLQEISENVLNIKHDSNCLCFKHLSNTYIDTDDNIYIGESNLTSRIYNTTIICDKIIWKTPNVYIEINGSGNYLLVSRSNVLSDSNIKFDIRISDEENLKVSWPNIKTFYRLIPYSYEFEVEDSEDIIKFIYAVKKITSCLRKHKKDAPARDLEFIENVIVGNSKIKNKILSFLIDIGLLYIDPSESHLYKMNINKLNEYGLSWEGLNQNIGDFKKIYSTYKKYIDKNN